MSKNKNLSLLFYLSCYAHSVEDIPQNDADHNVISKIKDDAFAVVFTLSGTTRLIFGRWFYRSSSLFQRRMQIK